MYYALTVQIMTPLEVRDEVQYFQRRQYPSNI